MVDPRFPDYGFRWLDNTADNSSAARVVIGSFATILGVQEEGADPVVVLSFRSDGQELEVLRRAGHPFFVLGWGRDAMGMVLDDPDWDEVAELVAESFCVLAPKKLASRIDHPPASEP